jgi:PII-like signaling protein
LLLLEKVRMEVYLPDLRTSSYRDLLEAFEMEFTYTFGGCTVLRGIDGNYLSKAGTIMPDRINLIYTDLPFSLTVHLDVIRRYVEKIKRATFEALEEEEILVTVSQIFHAV